MKIKNKGKVYPSPSSSSSNDRDVLSVLKLLPAAILALVSVLSFEDREVLAYMITRSMKTSSTSSLVQESKKRSTKKASNTNTHKPPVFDCDCFDCYRSYWFRWDSSPNRELIHQAIEAFEDHLTNGEKSHLRSGGRGKRREKTGRREALKAADVKVQPDVPVPESAKPEIGEDSIAMVPSDNDLIPVSSPERTEDAEGIKRREEQAMEEVEGLSPAEEDMAVFVRTAAASNNKGLARKVLPDVLGLLNSRLWSLWGPSV
ncbi:hypothetical protein FNV43_RR25746 [Rhamnella rubrinervis]|uniref:Uncharacterized protein n=1 Tax=Rhamnella rubrinervis TaxID=2594499 RepID=A0A8K0DIE7_9ROSA|nr:hypothetical protein FNV43_RR25746 [Rhamnella rubrinervis]